MSSPDRPSPEEIAEAAMLITYPSVAHMRQRRGGDYTRPQAHWMDIAAKAVDLERGKCTSEELKEAIREAAAIDAARIADWCRRADEEKAALEADIMGLVGL